MRAQQLLLSKARKWLRACIVSWPPCSSLRPTEGQEETIKRWLNQLVKQVPSPSHTGANNLLGLKQLLCTHKVTHTCMPHTSVHAHQYGACMNSHTYMHGGITYIHICTHTCRTTHLYMHKRHMVELYIYTHVQTYNRRSQNVRICILRSHAGIQVHCTHIYTCIQGDSWSGLGIQSHSSALHTQP